MTTGLLPVAWKSPSNALLAVYASATANAGMNKSSASGFAKAPAFLTPRPAMTSRTASSVILPLRVRGMSSTAAITAGTCRGLAPFSNTRLKFLHERARQHLTGLHSNKQHDARITVVLWLTTTASMISSMVSTCR